MRYQGLTCCDIVSPPWGAQIEILYNNIPCRYQLLTIAQLVRATTRIFN